MSIPHTPGAAGPEAPAVKAVLGAADRAYPFGPSFFLGYLARFVRDHCPDPEEKLPVVQLNLADTSVVNVCHIIGVSAQWVMVAARSGADHQDEMTVELVPYALIQRVSIRARRGEGASIGFSQSGSPTIIASETLLQAALPTDTHGEHTHSEH